MTKYTVAITEVIEYLVPVDVDSEEAAEQVGIETIISSSDRDKYVVDCRARECEGVNKGWTDHDEAIAKAEKLGVPDVLHTYLDGLDALTDGRGFDANHEAARLHVERAVRSYDRMAAMLRTLANMTTPMDGLLNRDSMHLDMVLAERSEDQICGDADALYRMIEEARTILEAI